MNNYTENRRRLRDILAGDTEDLRRAWDQAEEAEDYKPIPTGWYTCSVKDISLFRSRKETPGVKVVFAIAEGEHAGRSVFHDAWLTPAAMPMTKRDLGRLGISNLDQLENGEHASARMRYTVHVTRREDSDGVPYNCIRSFEALDEVPVEDAAFGPSPEVSGNNGDRRTATSPDDLDL